MHVLSPYAASDIKAFVLLYSCGHYVWCAVIIMYVSFFWRLCLTQHARHYIRSHFFPALFQLFLSVYCYSRRLSLLCHHLVASRHAGMCLVVLGPLGQMLLPSSWPKIVKAVLLNIPKACWITVLLLPVCHRPTASRFRGHLYYIPFG